MAKLVIGNPINTPVIKNKFILELSFMHGDSDSYSSEEYEYDLRDKGLLEAILTAIDDIKDKTGCNTEEIEDLIDEYKEVYLHKEAQKNEESIGSILSYLWEGDCIRTDCRAELNYDVYFYDENGVKKDVSVV